MNGKIDLIAALAPVFVVVDGQIKLVKTVEAIRLVGEWWP